MKSFTPRETVGELDRHIIGQDEAKKAVAIALRNRWRRSKIEDSELQKEILPKNILMIGPTGVGKTEISRRLAKLASAPFVKVEATKFTEIGYVGRDVEQIVRDLVETAVAIEKEAMYKKVKSLAEEKAHERIIDILVGQDAKDTTRDKFMDKLEKGALDDKEIEVEIKDNKNNQGLEITGMPGAQIGMINMGDIFGKAFNSTKKKKITIKQALEILIKDISEDLVDMDKINSQALTLAQENGIVFIDEIDKICGRSNHSGADVSREGVQRDLLPLIEGCTVSTKYGSVQTEHILFITSGAFHTNKPADLLPELQGRLPIRVNLSNLNKEDFVKILKEPEANLVRQYKELMKTENLELEFTDDAIEEIASLAVDINCSIENIGARRLHTIMEKVLEDISFTACDKSGKHITIDATYVKDTISPFAQSSDLSKFIL